MAAAGQAFGLARAAPGITFLVNSPGLAVRVTEALHGMEAVAEHINEMQKIYEEYGSTFDELAKQYRDVFSHSKVGLCLLS